MRTVCLSVQVKDVYVGRDLRGFCVSIKGEEKEKILVGKETKEEGSKKECRPPYSAGAVCKGRSQAGGECVICVDVCEVCGCVM